MYSLTDEQVDYVLNDIRRNGIEMEDLQLNLLDHICCIIEQELKENDDFERFYHHTIKQFYRKELHEIEEETINLLMFKNYYAMKKVMIAAGAFSAFAFIIGSIFKVMYWPGASVLLVAAIFTMSFVFLPLLFMLKTREAKKQQDKLLLGIGTLVGILYCLSTVFLVMHWPGSRMIWLTTLSLSFFVLVPLFFFTGIRKAETKVNTIVATILLLGFLGLQFTITGIRTSPDTQGKIYAYLQTEDLLNNAVQVNKGPADKLVQDIQNTCQQIKIKLLEHDMGYTSIPLDFERTGAIIREKNSWKYFNEGEGLALLNKLRADVNVYNASEHSRVYGKIPIERSILSPGILTKGFCSTMFVLNNITQLQLFLANTQPVNNKVITTARN